MIQAYTNLVGDEDSVDIGCAILQCNLQDIVSEKLESNVMSKLTMGEMETVIYDFLSPHIEGLVVAHHRVGGGK